MKYNPITMMMEDTKTIDVAYPKNKQQMERVITQYIKYAKKIENDVKQIEKIVDNYYQHENDFGHIFNYLGEEENKWIRELGKMEDVMDANDLIRKAKQLFRSL